MREILFKAKSVDNGKWVTGYYQKRHGNFGQIEHLIFHSVSALDWEYVEINPDTLCQYTGLVDRNGIKIWENDVVYIPYNCLEDSYCKVIFIRGQFVGELVDGTYDSILNQRTEVIGNIFDNAELLGGDK